MFVIVGTGAGGGLLARELAKNGKEVTIIEKGPYIESKDAFNYYNEYVPEVDLLATTCVGGSTVVSMANMVRALDSELHEYGIDLSKEYEYVEELVGVHELDDSHIGKGTQLFLDAARELGLNTQKMPKAIREEDCIQCGKCAFGCPVDAKWTAKDFVDEAVEAGATLISDAVVTDIILCNLEACGVKYVKDGEEFLIKSKKIILCAGAIESAVILKSSGLTGIGRELFFDPFVTVGGYLKDINFNTEVQMAGLVIGKNFVLSPHFSTFIYDDGEAIDAKDTLSIMVKTPDEAKGYVHSDGFIQKVNTINDIRYLAEGVAVAGMILEKAGVDPKTISSTVYRGAHPGGTAAIGKVVDSNLETEIPNLYVCDASVLPIAPGKPPILTILALSKRLADYLIRGY
ncbi:MAG: GMC family oxidoreductase [Methanobrevibacter sp.]|uniref:GMC family oxidoreductase N-terminal domain-containing protein n=1 Tax=Methanobrevibacter sp. TaxID=66852 RepID=UPI0025DB53C5|nr:GMC family oxidoreductase N-terminal domain-containing protein [Methanobrevibacter sp.]MBQ6100078.1 GMC family oxidoreductase [Methanobrevibacter sp.]